MDGPHLPVPRADRGLHRPAPAEFGAAPGGLPLRHRLRHQQRVRLRLPPGQHGHASGPACAAQAPLCHRGRGGQRPHRRGADAVDHLRPHTQGRRARIRAAQAQGGPARSEAAPGGQRIHHGGQEEARCGWGRQGDRPHRGTRSVPCPSRPAQDEVAHQVPE